MSYISSLTSLIADVNFENVFQIFGSYSSLSSWMVTGKKKKCWQGSHLFQCDAGISLDGWVAQRHNKDKEKEEEIWPLFSLAGKDLLLLPLWRRDSMSLCKILRWAALFWLSTFFNGCKLSKTWNHKNCSVLRVLHIKSLVMYVCPGCTYLYLINGLFLIDSRKIPQSYTICFGFLSTRKENCDNITCLILWKKWLAANIWLGILSICENVCGVIVNARV